MNARRLTQALAAPTAVFALAVLLLGTAANASIITVGNELYDRGEEDTFATYVTVEEAPVGYTIVSFSFYDAGGGAVTPLLVEKTASTTYTIRGVGTSRNPTTAGVYTFDFGLTSGSDAVAGADYFFAWHGGNSIPRNSDFSNPADGGGFAGPFLRNNSSFPGTTFDASFPLNNRAYSIQATYLVIPEPGTGLLVLAGLGLLLRLRRAWRVSRP
jgi:hypothetical protein